MALRGDLASVDLAQVFQMLALNQKVGLLSIQSRQLWKVLAFDHRGVTVHHNRHAALERVVASFVRTGRITEQALEEVRDHSARTRQELADGLLAGGYLEPDELDYQYRTELEEEIYDLFFCRDARFEFYEGATHIEGYEGFTDERYFFHCDSIVMEAARRIDEWAYIVERVPSTNEFYIAVAESISIDEFGTEGAAVFELLDGRRSVQRLIELTGLPNFQACKAISQMIDAGAVAPVHDDELVELAQECEGDGRPLDAVNLFERAASRGIGGAEVHAMAAAVYKSVARFEDMVRHLEAEAELLVTAGDVGRAAARLLEAKEVLPTALGIRERLVALAIESGVDLPGFSALAEGKEIVELLLEFGDVERVRRLLEQLLKVEPDDIDLKKALVSVHVKAGDQQRVAELYESIAEDLVKKGHPLEAVGYLQKILLMDRGRTDISERVRKLYEHDERSRRRTRMLGTLAVMLVLLCGLGAFYWFYNDTAAKAYNEIDVREMLAHDDFAGAAIAYKEFIRKYPLTTSVPLAEAELQEIEASRQRFDARLAADRAVRERELQRIRMNYQREWVRHRELFLGGDPEQSLEVLRRVRELVAVAGAPTDLEWALEQKVERTWLRLSQYLAESKQLAEEYDKAVGAKDWDQARTVALKLKSEYENTAAAKGAAVPVMVHTRPEGARLLQGGTPLQRVAGGRSEPLLTPTIVLCAEANQELEIVAERAGFVPRTLVITPREQASVEVVLEVVPTHRVEFPAKLQTGVATGAGWVVAGLRGGRLGIARNDGTDVRAVELAGLKAVDSTPVVQGGRAFFLSNENTVECIDLETGASAAGWPAPLPNGASTGLAAGQGRVAVVDGESVVHCWEQSTGSRLWSLSLGRPASGPPTIHRRQVLVGTADGRVYIIDAASGNTLGVLRNGDGIATRIQTDGDRILFGSSNGTVRVVEIATGRVAWARNLGAPIVDGMLALGQDVVCGVGEGKVYFWAKDTGAELGTVVVDGVAKPDAAIYGRRLFVRLERPKMRHRPQRDVLQAIDVESRTALWEYESDGEQSRTFGADDLVVAFAATANTIAVFR